MSNNTFVKEYKRIRNGKTQVVKATQRGVVKEVVCKGCGISFQVNGVRNTRKFHNRKCYEEDWKQRVPGHNKGQRGVQLAWNKGLNQNTSPSVKRYTLSMTKKVQKQFATGERRAFLARKYKPNKVETILLDRLKAEGLNPIFSYPIYFASPPDTIVDFYFPEVKLAVYVDGGFHDKSFSPENAIRDEKITKALKKEGYQVLRFKDREIRRKLEDCMYKIRSELLPEYLMNGSLS